jgi:hypothetical protein
VSRDVRRLAPQFWKAEDKSAPRPKLSAAGVPVFEKSQSRCASVASEGSTKPVDSREEARPDRAGRDAGERDRAATRQGNERRAVGGGADREGLAAQVEPVAFTGVEARDL